MEPRIETIEPKKLIGMRMGMSLSQNKTADLWRQFMPRRAEVKNRVSADYISMQRYGEHWTFSPEDRFEKWAAVEVSSFSHVPPDMETYVMQGGTYAVFVHHGPAHAAAKTMQAIFGQWLPTSAYVLDQREHFEMLPEGYRPVDPNAKEDIWIPIKESI